MNSFNENRQPASLILQMEAEQGPEKLKAFLETLENYYVEFKATADSLKGAIDNSTAYSDHMIDGLIKACPQNKLNLTVKRLNFRLEILEIGLQYISQTCKAPTFRPLPVEVAFIKATRDLYSQLTEVLKILLKNNDFKVSLSHLGLLGRLRPRARPPPPLLRPHRQPRPRRGRPRPVSPQSASSPDHSLGARARVARGPGPPRPRPRRPEEPGSRDGGAPSRRRDPRRPPPAR